MFIQGPYEKKNPSVDESHTTDSLVSCPKSIS